MKMVFTLIGLNVLLTAYCMHHCNGQNAWINEIHYDNAGADVNEMIEVVVEDPGSYELSLFEVILYNGSNGNAYNTKNLDLFTAGDTVGGYVVYYCIYPVNGIQNGAPDGVALAYDGIVLAGQFLSYEGAFQAAGGPAAGMFSNDIGVSEEPGPPVGLSLQLAGAGFGYDNFSWSEPSPATPGQINYAQVLGSNILPEPSNYPTGFMAAASSVALHCIWNDAAGPLQPDGYLVLIGDQLNLVMPADGVPVSDDTDLSDGSGALNVAFGTGACPFYGLAGSTEYFCTIYPYTNTDTLIDYKTDGEPPMASATTEPVVLSQNFESGTFVEWSVYDLSGPDGWEVIFPGGACQTDYFAQINYISAGEPANDWLISPPVNMEELSGARLTFFTRRPAEDEDTYLSLLYSSDYTDGNPMEASWTGIPYDKPSEGDTWTYSGAAPLTGLTGENIRFAFQYFSMGITGRWDVDEIVLTGYLEEPLYIPQIMITEIMYNPPETGTDTLEFIELYNNDSLSVNMAGYTFASGVSFTFHSHWLEPGEFVIVAADSVKFGNFFGLPAYRYSGTLSNNGELLLLQNSLGMTIDSVFYDDAGPWPTRPDGNGPSLTFCNPSFDNALGENWASSYEFAGVNANGDSLFASPGALGILPPVADFYADDPIVLAGTTANFIDLSTGIPDYWEWTFEGGIPGSHIGPEPPPVLYIQPGSYSVSMFVSNISGSSVMEKVNYIRVGNPPVADFHGIPVSVYEGGIIDFTDLSSGEPTGWQWQFEGGTPDASTEKDPLGIRYEAPGIYDVILWVSNIFGSDELLKENYIDVMPVGIDEPGRALPYLYPNPNQGIFRLVNPGMMELEVKVFDEMGKLVAGSGSSQGAIDFNLEAYGKGIYFLQVRDAESGQESVRKVLVN